MTQVQQFNMAEVSKEIRNAIREINAKKKEYRGVSDAIVCSVRINRQWETLKSEPHSVLYIQGLCKPTDSVASDLWDLVDNVCEKYGLKMIGEHDTWNIQYTLVKDL